jgi:hypothetical protein
VTLFPFDTSKANAPAWSFSEFPLDRGFVGGNEYYRFDPVQGVERIDYTSGSYRPSERALTDPADKGLIASGLSSEGRSITIPEFIEGIGGSALYRASRRNDLPEAEDPARSGLDLWVGIQGHLFAPLDTTVSVTDTVFVLEIVHRPATDSDRPAVLDRIGVTKSALLGDQDVRDVRAYRTVRKRSSVRANVGDAPCLLGPKLSGPESANSGNDACVADGTIDVRVYWTGRERAALRSVSVGVGMP